MKFILLVKRIASVSENGEKTVHTERVYKGKIGTSDGETLIVRGTDLSSLNVFNIKKQNTVTGPAIKSVSSVADLSNVLGKANFDFANKNLRIDLYNGEKKLYKLVEVNRRAINEIAPGKIVSEIAKGRVPFLKRLFPGDRISEQSIVVEELEAKEKPTVLDRETRRFSLLEWFKKVFSSRANTAKLTN